MPPARGESCSTSGRAAAPRVLRGSLARRPNPPGQPRGETLAPGALPGGGFAREAARRASAAALSALLALGSAAPPAWAAAAPPRGPPSPPAAAPAPPGVPAEFPPLAELRPAAYTRTKLKNGLVVYLFEDHEVPLLRGTLVFRGGSRVEPAGLTGVTQLMAAVQRSGGSEGHPGARLEEALDELAARVETNTSESATSVGFECLPEDRGRVLPLFFEVATAPAFPEDKLGLVQTQALDSIAHRNDSAGGIPARELRKLLYGPLSPYARLASAASVKAVTRGDLVAYHDAWQRPDLAYLGIVGDFDAREMRAEVEALFGPWRPAEGQPRAPPKVPPAPVPYLAPGAAPGAGPAKRAAPPSDPAPIYLVNKPGAATATVAFGELGVRVTDRDAASLDVANTMLSSFGGRLFTEVRSKRGLAYSVSGRWNMEATYDGTFVVTASSDRPAQLIARAQEVLQGLVDEVPPREEVERAKGQALNSFAFNFSSVPAQMARVVSYDLYGLPPDFLTKVQRDIQRVTPESVHRAVRAHLHLSRQPIVVVGDAAKIRKDLEALGRPIVPLRPE